MPAREPKQASRYSKQKGYRVEKLALAALRMVFPDLRRTGSVAYKKSAADLVQESMVGPEKVYHIVVTKDDRSPLLVTLPAAEFAELVREPSYAFTRGVKVQVKAREKTWIGGLYKELVSGAAD